MIYIDLTPGELDRLLDFHKKYPDNTLRVYSDEIVDSEKKTYRKTVEDYDGHSTDIADEHYI